MHGVFFPCCILTLIVMWVLISGHRSVSLMPLGYWAGKDEQTESLGEWCSTCSSHHVPTSLSACAFPQPRDAQQHFWEPAQRDREFSLFLGLWSPFIHFLKNCLGHSTSRFSAKCNASALPVINEVIFSTILRTEVCCCNHMPLICDTLSLSACSVLSLLIASPMDCSAPVAAHGLLTQGQEFQGEAELCTACAAFQLTHSCTLASLPSSADDQGCHRVWVLLRTLSKGRI